MKKSHNIFSALILPALLILGVASSCNKKSDDDEDAIVVTVSTVAVSNFSLKADTKVHANLDSVFFSIDLNKAVIFNADSLPKGTSVRRLIPVITFSSTMTEAELVFTDSLGSQKTVDYLETQTDSIDFTNDVLLNVTAADGKSKFTYTIKVNVHKQVPDSLMWDKISMATLPSRNGNPIQQKTVVRDASAFTLIEEKDHSYTLAKASDYSDGFSSKIEIALPFTPFIESFTATSDAFYILDTSGMLYSSSDLTSWFSTGQQWISVIGGYGNNVLGIQSTDSGLIHCHYPASSLISDSPVANDFPIYGRSELVCLSNRWTPQPTAFFVGGKTADGSLSNHTWAFDGSMWANVDDESLPPVEGMAIAKYTVYRSTVYLFVEKAYDAWLAFGGRLEDGSFNRTLYYSFDNGVKWIAAPELMQFPEYIPSLYAPDAVVLKTKLNDNISDIWKPSPAKIASRSSDYVIDGDNISWDCPYIYIIGGTLPDGTLSDSVWRGVLTRLTFTPLI